MSSVRLPLLVLSLALLLDHFPLQAAGFPNTLNAHPNRADVRMLQWAGRTWRVRSWSGGPGPNQWCDAPDCVWVDADGALHLTIRNIDGVWYASEINTEDFSNFGEHRFYVEGPIDDLDPNVVLGLFLYSNIEDDDIEELDVEFATWGDPSPQADEGWYTTWFQNAIGEQYSFDTTLQGGDYTTHAIDWQPDQVNFESLHGFHQQPPDSSYIIAQWSATDPNDIPAAGDEMRIHLNLWLMNGLPPMDGQEVEIIVHDLEAPPEIPKDVQASDGVSASGVTVQWDDLPTADSYEVYRATDETAPKTLLGSTDETQFEDATASFDATYFYQVVGVNAFGKSLFSAGDAGWRAIPLHVSPKLANNDVVLQWEDHEAACSYQLFRESQPYFDPSNVSPAVTLDATASSYTFFDDAGSAAENHYYLNEAIGCASGNASPSNRTGEFDFPLSPGV